MPTLTRVFCSLCVVLLFSACSTAPPTHAQIVGTDIGPAPKQEIAEGIANDYLRNTLKDPGSAQKEFGKVQRGYYTKPPIRGGGSKIAWCLPVGVNAKNSYGGYTGIKLYSFYFLHGKLVATLTPDVMYMSGGPVHYSAVSEFNGGGVKPIRVEVSPRD